MTPPEPLLRAFRFKVVLTKEGTDANDGERPSFGEGGFQDCSGLEVEMDAREYLEGGNNNGVIRQVGRAKYTNLVLKRGMFYTEGAGANRDVWNWIQAIVNGVRPVPRYDGIVQVMSVGEEVAATWTFDRGLPVRVRGPELNAKTGEVAIEELHIAHEGLRLTVS